MLQHLDILITRGNRVAGGAGTAAKSSAVCSRLGQLRDATISSANLTGIESIPDRLWRRGAAPLLARRTRTCRRSLGAGHRQSRNHAQPLARCPRRSPKFKKRRAARRAALVGIAESAGARSASQTPCCRHFRNRLQKASIRRQNRDGMGRCAGVRCVSPASRRWLASSAAGRGLKPSTHAHLLGCPRRIKHKAASPPIPVICGSQIPNNTAPANRGVHRVATRSKNVA